MGTTWPSISKCNHNQNTKCKTFLFTCPDDTASATSKSHNISNLDHQHKKKKKLLRKPRPMQTFPFQITVTHITPVLLLPHQHRTHTSTTPSMQINQCHINYFGVVDVARKRFSKVQTTKMNNRRNKTSLWKR